MGKTINFLKRYRIQIGLITAAIIVWFGDSIIDALFFYEEPFGDIAFTKVPYFEYYFRFSLIALLLIIGYILFRREREKRIARDSIERERKQMLLIFDSINQPIYIIDPENYEIIYTNKALRDIYGHEVKKKCYEYFLDGDAPCHECLMGDVKKLDMKGVYPREFYNPKTKKHFACIDRRMKWADGRDVIYTFSIDITEQKRLETERSRTNKFETMEIIAGTLVHDFNNLLATMIMSISLAKNYTKDVEKASSLLSMAEDAAYRAKDITHRLLTFTKDSEPQFEYVDFRKILKQTADFILKETKIEYEINIDKNVPKLNIDVGQMVQVVNNLLINAKQAVGENGKIEIKMYTVDTSDIREIHDKTGMYACISVRDNGEGIKEKNMSKIFTPYFTTKKDGMGLGLASCFSIVSKHGGIIAVDSKESEGTEFRVYIPVSELHGLSGEEGEDKIEDDIRILLLEDDKLVGGVTGMLINHLGYRIDFTDDESKAMELFKSYRESGDPVKIVMIDLTSPHNINPKILLDRFRVMDPNIRSILTSGIDNETILKEYIDYGFNSVLKKPFRTRDIVSAVNKALQ